MSPKHRRERSEDVLQLHDLDSHRMRGLIVAAVALLLLVYALSLLAEVSAMSLDQQEDLSERLGKTRRQLDQLRSESVMSAPAAPSPSEPAKT